MHNAGGELLLMGILRSSLSAYRASTGPGGILRGVPVFIMLVLLAALVRIPITTHNAAFASRPLCVARGL
jgi:hypothetical protein